MISSSKENANPTIHAVRRRPAVRSDQNKSVGYMEIRRFANVASSPNYAYLYFGDGRGTRSDESGKGGKVLSTPEKVVATPVEKSVFLALKDVSTFDDGSNTPPLGDDGVDHVRLLREAGFFVNTSRRTNDASFVTKPTFLPAQKPLQSALSLGGEVNDAPKTLNEVGETRDPFDEEEVFDMIRTINDPEHPLTLEQLNVVNEADIEVFDAFSTGEAVEPQMATSMMPVTKRLSSVKVEFTPTIPHCSMATLIGLCIRVKLLRSLPARFKVTVKIKAGTHASELAVNKQLADKERVAAALENQHLLGVVNKCIGRLD